MTHLTDTELRAWLQGSQDGRDRVIAHLAACDKCGGALAEMLRTAPADAPPTAFNVAEFTAAGRDAGQWRAGRRRSLHSYWPAIAAAAAIVVAAVYIAPLRRAPGVTRSTGSVVQLVQPAGDVDASSLTFSWEGPAGQYRLRVYDLAAPDAPVLSRDAVASGYKPSPEEAALLRPGVTYRWFVEGPEGAPAPAGRFTIR